MEEQPQTLAYKPSHVLYTSSLVSSTEFSSSLRMNLPSLDQAQEQIRCGTHRLGHFAIEKATLMSDREETRVGALQVYNIVALHSCVVFWRRDLGESILSKGEPLFAYRLRAQKKLPESDERLKSNNNNNSNNNEDSVVGVTFTYTGSNNSPNTTSSRVVTVGQAGMPDLDSSDDSDSFEAVKKNVGVFFGGGAKKKEENDENDENDADLSRNRVFDEPSNDDDDDDDEDNDDDMKYVLKDGYTEEFHEEDNDSSNDDDSIEECEENVFRWEDDIAVAICRVPVSPIDGGNSFFSARNTVLCVVAGEWHLMQGVMSRIDKRTRVLCSHYNNQNFAEKKSSSIEEAAAELEAILEDFHSVVESDARKIIEEDSLPKKMRSVTRDEQRLAGGILGGEKFISNGVLYKFLKPDGKVANMDIAQVLGPRGKLRFLHKIPGLDLKGYCSVFHYLWTSGASEDGKVRAPYQAVVDYCGFRVLAQSLLPLHGDETLVSGSADGGRNFSDILDAVEGGSSVKRICKEMGAFFGLCEHRVKNGINSVFLAGDVEVHKGRDEVFYLIDLNRVLPPLPPVSTDMSSKVFSQHFREEATIFLKAKTSVLVNADAGTNFIPVAEKKKALDDLKVWKNSLIERVLPVASTFVKDVQTKKFAEAVDGCMHFSFLLRKAGLNQCLGGFVVGMLDYLSLFWKSDKVSKDAIQTKLAALKEQSDVLEQLARGLDHTRMDKIDSKQVADRVVWFGMCMLIARVLKFELRIQLQQELTMESRRGVARNFFELISKALPENVPIKDELVSEFSCSQMLAHEICQMYNRDGEMRKVVLELLLSFQVVSIKYASDYVRYGLWNRLSTADVSFPLRMKTSTLPIVSRALRDIARLGQLRNETDQSAADGFRVYDRISQELLALLRSTVVHHPSDEVLQVTLGSLYVEISYYNWLRITRLVKRYVAANSDSERDSMTVELCAHAKTIMSLFRDGSAAFKFRTSPPDTSVCASGLKELLRMQQSWRDVRNDLKRCGGGKSGNVLNLLNSIVDETHDDQIDAELVLLDEALLNFRSQILGGKKISHSVQHLLEKSESGRKAIRSRDVSDRTSSSSVDESAAYTHVPTPPGTKMTGILWKKGKEAASKNRERFFVLLQGQLRYYQRVASNNFVQRGFIPLSIGTAVQRVDLVTITIRPPGRFRKYRLTAQSGELAKLWVDAIIDACK